MKKERKKDASAKPIRRVSSARSRNNSKRRKNNNKLDKNGKEKQIIIKRSSGRQEKFDANKMTQTVSRSGVPFLMARDVAENVSNKIRKDVSGGEARQGTEDKTVSASQIRAQVAAELRDRNRTDIAASYSGQTPENTLGDQFHKQNKKDRISVTGATQHTRQPANRNRVIHDMSKRGGGIST
jgi:ATP cone domain